MCLKAILGFDVSSLPLKVLVLGATGMLGNTIVRLLSGSPGFRVFATVRSSAVSDFWGNYPGVEFLKNVDVSNLNDVARSFIISRPDIVINCIGLVKQLAASDEALSAIPVNSLLPHQLADLCGASKSRLIHISTDCVFSGKKGMYKEDDVPDASDLYGRSKFLGEVDYSHGITLRTSIIGHEIYGARSLLCWFLSQRERVSGYTRAIFSGLPTIELAHIIRDVIIPAPDLRGVYHVASDPIDKFSLLKLIAEVYSKSIEIIPNDQLVIDRSLCADRLRLATGYVAPDWSVLVRKMQDFR